MEVVSEFYSDDERVEAHVCKATEGHVIMFYEDGEVVAIRNYPENSLAYIETVAENHVMGLKQY